MRIWPRTREPRIAIALVAVALLPLAVLVVRLIARSWVPLDGDDSLITLRVHDVFTAHTPLVGSYERYGFNQPGPAWFYVLALPYRILGTRFSGIQIGAVLVHALSIVLVARVMYRRFGLAAMAWALLVLTALLWGFGPGTVADPWEPYVSAVLLCAVAVLAFDAAYGTLSSWIWVAVLASVVMQMYTTAGLVALALLVWGIVIGAVRLARAGEGSAVLRRLGIAAGVGVVLWLPAIVQQFRDSPGNMTRIVRFARQQHTNIGLGDAFGALRLQTWFPAVWLGRKVPLEPLTTTLDPHHAPWFPGSIIVLIAVAVIAWRAHAAPQLLLCGTVAVAALATVAGLSRLSLPFYVWLIEPTRAAGALLWLPLGTLVMLVASARVRNALTGVIAIGLVVLAVAFAVRSARDQLGPPREVNALGRLAAAAKPALRAGSGPVAVRSEVRGQLLAPDGFGHDELIADLAVKGFDMVSGSRPGDLNATTRFGAFRAHPERATRTLVLQVDGTRPPAGGAVIARADPLSPTERAARIRLEREIAGVCGVGDLHKLQRCKATHPEVARWLDELRPIPDLPALQLALVS